MIRVAYFSRATRIVSSILSGPSLEGMPDPDGSELAIMTDYDGALPAIFNGAIVVAQAPQPSPAHEWSGDVKAWVLNQALLPQALAEQQTNAQAQIDAAAGRARLRYITDVPGQQGTYQIKGEQAREWAGAGFPETVPSYIAAEARRTRSSPQAVAEKIITLEHLWVEVKGPEIESARVGWKEEIRACTTLEDIQDTLSHALAELEAL